MTTTKGRGRLLNRTELANDLGIAMPTLDDWVRRGCPVVQRGGRGRPWAFNTADVRAWRDDDVRKDAAGQDDVTSDELKRRKLRAETLKAELELARDSGEVAPLWQIEKAMQKAFAEVRANMRNIPSRAARLLIGETDEVRFERVMLEEIDQALDAMAEADLVDIDDLEPDDLDGGGDE